MNKLFLWVLALAGFASAQISSLSLPHTIDTATIPKVSYVDDNDVALKNRLNIVIDSVNSDSILTLLQSNSSLRLTVDADANATGTCFAITHNGASDTIAKFCDDLSSKAFGAQTVAGTLAVTEALTLTANPIFSWLTANKIPYSSDASGNMTSTSNLTYTSGTSTFATANGTYSGTLGVTGILSANGTCFCLMEGG